MFSAVYLCYKMLLDKAEFTLEEIKKVSAIRCWGFVHFSKRSWCRTKESCILITQRECSFE